MQRHQLITSLSFDRIISGALLFALLVACSDSSNQSTDGLTEVTPLTGCADTQSCVSNPPSEIVASRPAGVRIPSDYTTTTRYPLIIQLHGFGANGFLQSLYLGLNSRVDEFQYILVFPDGTRNLEGRRFWNATPFCCAPSDNEFDIDDVAYIRTLIEEAAATYSIDVDRIGLVGHSNGGGMTLRMVCEASDLVTAAVSLAGFTYPDDSNCTPAAQPVRVLAMHGTADDTVLYQGEDVDSEFGYPSAMETIRRFAGHAQCDIDAPVNAPNINVDGSIPGAETEVLQYTNCPSGVNADLWTMVGSAHSPLPWEASGLDLLVRWIVDHPRVRP